jgi:hypothetical protein
MHTLDLKLRYAYKDSFHDYMMIEHHHFRLVSHFCDVTGLCAVLLSPILRVI